MEWNGRVVSQLKTSLATLFLPISDSIEANPIVVCSASIDEEVEKDSDIEDTDNEKPYSNKEIITDIAMAGIGAAGGLIGIPPAIVEIANGSACFIDAAKKYNENVRFENEKESNSYEKDDCDRAHDHDSWDREY